MTNSVTVVVPPKLLPALLAGVRQDSAGTMVENVVFGLARPYRAGRRTTLRLEDVLTFAPEDYAVRQAYAVGLSRDALARVVAAVSRRRLVPVKFHRHPMAANQPLAYFSMTDDDADRELGELFGEDGFASVVLIEEPAGNYSMLARSVTALGDFSPASVVELGLPMRVHGTGTKVDLDAARFVRARLEFGAGVVNALSELRVGTLGAGGLGWRAGSSLCDIGLGSLVALDKDTIEEGNLLRLEGARPALVGQDKATALAGYLEARHEALDVVPVTVDVIEALDANGPARDQFEQVLASCDVLLLLSDNHPSRLSVLIEAERLGIPYIHCGMHQITPHDMYARLSIHVPGVTACAVCAGNVDRAQGSRRGRGYVEGARIPNVAAWSSVAGGHVANAVRMLAVPLPGERLRDIHAWELGLSWPSVRPVNVARPAECPICG